VSFQDSHALFRGDDNHKTKEEGESDEEAFA
jgi:hypothetical protein